MKTVIQFGFNIRLPKPGTPIVDCRIITNPHGKYPPREIPFVIRADPFFRSLVDQAKDLLKTHDVIAIGCAYGVHRSGEVVKLVEHELGRDEDVVIQRIGKSA